MRKRTITTIVLTTLTISLALTANAQSVIHDVPRRIPVKPTLKDGSMSDLASRPIRKIHVIRVDLKDQSGALQDANESMAKYLEDVTREAGMTVVDFKPDADVQISYYCGQVAPDVGPSCFGTIYTMEFLRYPKDNDPGNDIYMPIVVTTHHRQIDDLYRGQEKKWETGLKSFVNKIRGLARKGAQ